MRERKRNSKGQFISGMPDINLHSKEWHAACRAARLALRKSGLEATMSRYDFKRFWHDLRKAIREEGVV